MNSLFKLCGFENPSTLSGTEKIARLLRSDAALLAERLYVKNAASGRHASRNFFGHEIKTRDVNFLSPHLCPLCLKEGKPLKGAWDLEFVVCCPDHDVLLFNKCPTCGEKVRWNRHAVAHCPTCGFNYRDARTDLASAGQLALTRVIYDAAGFSVPSRAVTGQGYPEQLAQLPLADLLNILYLLGDTFFDQTKTLGMGTTVSKLSGNVPGMLETAHELLADWPFGMEKKLAEVIGQSEGSDRLDNTLRKTFGRFHLRICTFRSEDRFGFLVDAVENFLIERWDAPLKCNQLRHSESSLERRRWLTPPQASSLANDLTDQKLIRMVESGEIRGVVKPARNGERKRCWIDRESLQEWMAENAGDLARIGGAIPRADAETRLGTPHNTLMRLFHLGVVRGLMRTNGKRTTLALISEEDVNGLLDRLRPDRLPELAIANRRYVALEHVIRLHNLKGDGVLRVFAAITEGKLSPVGRYGVGNSIQNCVFRRKDVQQAAAEPGAAPVERMLNMYEACCKLDMDYAQLQAIMAAGHLAVADTRRSGLLKLVRERDVAAFRWQYLHGKELGTLIGIPTRSIRVRLSRKGIEPALVLPVGKAGKRTILLYELETLRDAGIAGETLPNRC